MDKIKIIGVLDDIFEDIYEIKYISSETYVLKVDVYKTEKDAHKSLCEIYKCSVNDISPKVISYCSKSKKSLIVFKNYKCYKSLLEYFGTFDLKSKKDYFDILDLMIVIYKKIFIMNFILGIYHGDLSTLNIVLDENSNPYFINFLFNYGPGDIFSDLVSFNKFFVNDLSSKYECINIGLCQYIIEIARIFLKKPPTIIQLDVIFNSVREQSVKILNKIL